jgi:hypothetical protein
MLHMDSIESSQSETKSQRLDAAVAFMKRRLGALGAPGRVSGEGPPRLTRGQVHLLEEEMRQGIRDPAPIFEKPLFRIAGVPNQLYTDASTPRYGWPSDVQFPAQLDEVVKDVGKGL